MSTQYPVQPKDRSVFLVTDPIYGAVMDGVTDDTAALTAAIAAAAAAGGGTVTIPAGTMVADPPAIPANITIAGAGRGRTIIKAATVNGTFYLHSVSNVTLQDFSFVGKSNNGVNATADGIFVYAQTADCADCAIRRVGVSQIKNDAAIRYAGNGDYTTNATFWVRRLTIEDCYITNYYDPDPTNLGVASYGIYGGCGSEGCHVVKNWVDGSYGKHGIGSIAEDIASLTDGNNIHNCGKLAPNTYYGYGIIKYSGTGTPCVDPRVVNNTIRYTNRAGIYIQAVERYTVNDNLIYQADQHSAGLGNVGVGAIMINNSGNDGRSGPGTVADNVIEDPGSIGIYINLAAYFVAPCQVTGNIMKMTTAGSTNLGLVLAGQGASFGDNTIQGFKTGVFFYESGDDITGNAVASNNTIDCAGAASGNAIGPYVSGSRLNNLTIVGNRIRNQTVGVALNYVDNLILSNNDFTGITGTVASIVAKHATVSGNVADGGTTGLQLVCVSGDATARIVTVGNTMLACTTPFLYTANSGVMIENVNDFTKGEFKVRWYGAKGDNATDDTTTIGAAITAAAATGGKVVCDRGTYLISGSGLSIPSGVDFIMDGGALLSYSGTGVAVTLNQCVGGRFDLAVQRSSVQWHDNATDTSSEGVRIRNCTFSQITVRKAVGFWKGINWYGDSASVGTQGCTLHLGYVDQCKISMGFTAVTGGFANQNTIIGGNLIFESSDLVSGSPVTGSRMLDMSAAGNGNTFVGVDFQGNICEKNIAIGSVMNFFFNCRYESIREVRCLAGSYGNCFFGGYQNPGKFDSITFYDDSHQNIIRNGYPAGGDYVHSYGTVAGGNSIPARTVYGLTSNASVVDEIIDSTGALASRLQCDSKVLGYPAAGSTFPVFQMDQRAGTLSYGDGTVTPSLFLNVPASAAPVSGTHTAGEFTPNSAPSELGSAGSKYVIRGWICTAGGTPGTWLQCRALTGN